MLKDRVVWGEACGVGMLVIDKFKLLLLIQEWSSLNCQASWENIPQGHWVLSISGWAWEGRAGQEAASIWSVWRGCSIPLDPARLVPSHPPFQRKLRLAGCLGEMTQWGSLAESCLLGPGSPAPQSQLPGA